MRHKWTKASFPEEREIIPKRWVIRLATVAVVVWAGFGIDSLLTWTPLKPDPRQITRENFGFEMFSQKRLLGWNVRDDVSGAEEKLNELFPPGTPLSEFIEFENAMKVPPSEFERFGQKTFGCDAIDDEMIFTCIHTYAGIGAFKFSAAWRTLAHFDNNEFIIHIDVTLGFVG